MRVSQALEQWANSHQTSKEIAGAIETLSGENCSETKYQDDDENPNPIMHRLWSDPDPSEQSEIIRMAWEMAEPDKDELYWGCDTIQRTKE